MRDAHSRGAPASHPRMHCPPPNALTRTTTTNTPFLRMLVLIFPATNYHPAGYDLVHRDEHMCRGAVFYAPGSASSNMINAHHVSPTLLVYRREERV